MKLVYMPYIQKERRINLDTAVESLAKGFMAHMEVNRTRYPSYLSDTIISVVTWMWLIRKNVTDPNHNPDEVLAQTILNTAKEGEGMGELNYSITRLIQIIPREMVDKKYWDKKLGYDVYQLNASSLEYAAHALFESALSVSDQDRKAFTIKCAGTLIDVKDEYKRRVNAPYEDDKIEENGDAYDEDLIKKKKD